MKKMAGVLRFELRLYKKSSAQKIFLLNDELNIVDIFFIYFIIELSKKLWGKIEWELS